MEFLKFDSLCLSSGCKIGLFPHYICTVQLVNYVSLQLVSDRSLFLLCVLKKISSEEYFSTLMSS